MIEKVLEAYEARTVGKENFRQRFRKMDRITQIAFGGSILGGITAFGIYIFYQSMGTLLIVVAYVAVLYISTLMLEKRGHTKWEKNLEDYKKDIDIIADILKQKEFDLYEKNKIKQLICKYYQSIKVHEKRNEKRNSDLKEFIYTYMIPIVAFFAGKLNTANYPNGEWIAFGFAIVIMMLCIKYVFYSLKQLIELLSWNRIEKEKNFVLKLQDLLDRDFVIEDSDILKEW